MNAAVLTEHKRAAQCSCLSLHTKEEGYPQGCEKNYMWKMPTLGAIMIVPPGPIRKAVRVEYESILRRYLFGLRLLAL